MKKTLLTVSLFFLCCWFGGYGQTPDWVWAKGAPSAPDSAGWSEGWSIATDKSNNVYITGEYLDTITFGSFILTSASSNAAFLAKYDSSANVLWAKSAVNGSGGYSFGRNLSMDIFGNIYITGYFADTVSFGSYTLTSASGYNVFLVKYDSSGNVLWAKSSGGAYGLGYGVSTDLSGNVYITGNFGSTTITFGSYTLTSAGSQDIFFAKYDSSGNVLLAKSASGNSTEIAYSVASDGLANVYITGCFYSPTITIGSYTLSSAGGWDIFLAKYDSSGNVLWAKSSGGTGDDRGTYVSADSSGNAYLTGCYSSPFISFGSYNLTNAGGYDAYLTKYDSSGNVRWAKSIGGTGFEQGYCIATDKSYRIYITGGFSSDTLIFDTILIQRPVVYSDPMYLAEYDSVGHALWAKVLASGGDDQNAVAASPSGCIYIGGDSQANPFIIGNDSLPGSGLEYVFVAKLCYSGLTASFTSSSSAICLEGNTCINFFDQSLGNVTAWHWHFTGATPDTSSLQNPDSICYSTPGTYPVQLIVSNGTVIDTLTVASMIIVDSLPSPPTISVVGGNTLVSSHGSSYQWYFNGNIIVGAIDSFYVAHQGGTYSVQITNQNGCQSLSAGMVITGMTDIGGVSVAVYPNPFSDELTITPNPLKGAMAANSPLGVGGEFTLFDVTSRVLLRRSFTNQTTIDTEQLARGLYFYEVRDKNNIVERGKLVKD